jgi:hypothetical protein
LRASCRICLDKQRAAEPADAMLHARDAVGAQLVLVGLADSLAVVPDHQHDVRRGQFERHVHFVRPGMFLDVEQCFLRDAKQRNGRAGVERRLDVGKMPVAAQPAATARLVHLPAHCCVESHVVEQRGSQLLDDTCRFRSIPWSSTSSTRASRLWTASGLQRCRVAATR